MIFVRGRWSASAPPKFILIEHRPLELSIAHRWAVAPTLGTVEIEESVREHLCAARAADFKKLKIFKIRQCYGSRPKSDHNFEIFFD